MSAPLQTSPALTRQRQIFNFTTSSRKISELVESRHDKVKQSIEHLAARGTIMLPIAILELAANGEFSLLKAAKAAEAPK